jgi:hypothetical protein
MNPPLKLSPPSTLLAAYRLASAARVCLAASFLPLGAWGCSSKSAGSTGAPTDADGGGMASHMDASAAGDHSVPGADGSVSTTEGGERGDSAVSPDASVSEDGANGTYSVPVGDCFTFATATIQNMQGQSCGDLLTLSGANIDLSSGSGASALCDLGGPFASLSAVPTSYASCMWTNYIEGGNGLAGEGIIVLDSAAVHHYKVRIVTNVGPDLVFSFADID